MHDPTLRAIIIIAIVAAITLLLRALPFLLFRGDRPLSGKIIYLGKVLPFAIISVLVIYCLKGVNLAVSPHGIPELVCCAVAAGLHIWKRNNLVSIGVSTALYMFMVQVLFAA